MNNKAIKIINWIMFFWVGFVAFLYAKNCNCLKYLIIIPIILAAYYYIKKQSQKNKISTDQYLQTKIKKIGIKNYYHTTITQLYVYIIISAFLITNSFIINKLISDFQPKNILNLLFFYELNSIQKILSIILFYTLFFVFVYSLGRKILNICKYEFSTKSTDLFFAIGVGFIPVIFITFLLALLGILYSWIIWIFVLFSIFLIFDEIKNTFADINKLTFTFKFSNTFNILKNLVFVFLFILLIFNFISIFKPFPVTSDDLNSYFNVPNIIVQNHKYAVFNNFAISNMGHNTEMVYAFIISLLDTKYIIHFSFAFFVLILFFTYKITKEIFNDKYAALSVLVIYLIPWNFYFINTCKVDFFLIFYSLLTLYALYLWRQNNFEKHYLYLLGIFSGICMGIKYVAALHILPFFFFCFFIILYKKKYQLIKSFLASSVLLILFFSPWAIKNQIFFSNPVYPFFEKNPKDSASLIEYNTKRNNEITLLRFGRNLARHSVKNFLHVIWDQATGKLIFQGTNMNYGFIPIIIFPFFLFYLKNKKIIFYIFFSLIYFLLWYTLNGIAPWYAFFGIFLSYIALPFLFLKNKKLIFIYFPILIIITLTKINIVPHNINYLIGKEDIDTFLYNNIRYYNTAKYINNNYDNLNGKILLIGDCSVALIKNNNNKLLIDNRLKKSGYYLNKSEQEYIKYLKSSSINYIIISKNIVKKFPLLLDKKISIKKYLDNYKGDIPSFYNDADRIIDFANKYGKYIYGDEHYYLYELNGNPSR